MKAEDLKIDVFQNTAVLTFIMASSFTAAGKTVDHRARSTLVLVKDKGAWKIAHEHFSDFKPGL